MSATDARDEGAEERRLDAERNMSDDETPKPASTLKDTTTQPEDVKVGDRSAADASVVKQDGQTPFGSKDEQGEPALDSAELPVDHETRESQRREPGEAREPAVESKSANEAGAPSSEIVGSHTPKQTTQGEDTSLTYRDKPRMGSPPPPAPPPKDASLSKLAAGKQPEQQDYDEKHPPEDDSVADPQTGADNEDQSEIQSIMDQFEEESKALGKDEIMSPRLEMASPVFFPPRGSSLEPESQGSPTSPSLRRPASRDSYNFNASKARPPSLSEGMPPPPPPASEKPDALPPQSPGGNSVFQPPPPSPDPEPALPFDFHRFLEQLRHRTADPVARFLRSFLNEFGKKQWQVHEQVKIISDFLEFIAKKMSQCEVWRTVSDAEFDNAREGMEKLVMNRLYSQTFSPAIPPVETVVRSGSRRAKAQAAASNGPGRRGQHQEDVERDDVIAQKIRIYGWIREEHLDIPSIGEKGRKFLALAQQELLKINSYRAPRDKVIQILNCCKVIFGFLKNNKTDQSADSFVPLLIYTVLKANPSHLASNVQYILRFRNQDKLGGEAGYYISSLMGVISFIETLDRTNLTISDEEFERHVEAAVSAIAEGHQAEDYESKTSLAPSAPTHAPANQEHSPLLASLTEKSAPSRPEVTPRNSMDAERALSTTPRRNLSNRLPRTSSDNGPATTGPSQSSTSSTGAEDIATGLLRTIQKPLSGIGRMFSDEDKPPPQPPRPQKSPTRGGGGAGYPGQGQASQLASSGEKGQTGTTREDSEVLRMFGGSRRGLSGQGQGRRSEDGRGERGLHGVPSGPGVGEHEAAVRQASANEAEAARIRSEEHRVVVE